ncbi:WD40-repeat-containing domain protein [Chlamydoabsidia padenii]|nr:WD40-repeat-containing domain protein [Chlamydoabsidia padenii]
MSFLSRLYRGSPPCKVNPHHDPLRQLPSELLIQLVSYLDLPSVLQLSSTSQFYHCLCDPSNHYLWHALYQSHYPHHQAKTIAYYALFRDLYSLDRRIHAGQAQSHYLVGHQDSVYCLAWINPHQVLSGSRDQTIKLWDVDQRKCLVTRQHHLGSVLCLATAGSFFVSGSSDSTLACWSLPDMVCDKVLQGHTGGVLDVCVVADAWIVSSSRDTTLRVWELKTGRARFRLVGHQGPVNALDHVKHSTLVLSASGDTTLKLWDVVTGDCLRTFVGHDRGLACVRFDPFLRSIISGGQDGTIKVWDFESTECLQTMTGHTDLVRTVDTYQGMVVSGSYDRTLKVWNASTGVCLLSFHSGHTSWIFNVLITNTKVLSAGQDKKIMILDFGYDLIHL